MFWSDKVRTNLIVFKYKSDSMYLIYAYLGYYIEFPFMKADQFCLESSKLWQHVNIE